MILLPSAIGAKQRSFIILLSIVVLCTMVQHLVGLQAYASLHSNSILHSLLCIETKFELDAQDDLTWSVMCQS